MSVSILNKAVIAPAAAAVPLPDDLGVSQGRQFVRSVTALIPAVTVFLAVLTGWQLLNMTGIVQAFILPAPLSILKALTKVYMVILDHARVTVLEALLGFVIGNAVAILTAILFVHNRTAERSFYPLTLAARSIPVVAVAPMLTIWLGSGITPKVLIGAFLVFFPTLVNMVRGLRSVDRDVMELLRSLSATQRQILWKVRLPAAMPFLFAALRIAAGSCFIAAIVSEWIGSDHGLGYLVVIYGTEFNIPEMWAAVLTASVLAMSAFGLVCLVERVSMPWAKYNDAPAA